MNTVKISIPEKRKKLRSLRVVMMNQMRWNNPEFRAKHRIACQMAATNRQLESNVDPQLKSDRK